MIDALIAGRLYGHAEAREGKNDSAYVTARVRAAAGDGSPLIVNVIAFADAVCDALLALDDGDSVTLSGALTPKAWTDKNGEARAALDMVAHAVLTAYHVSRTRQAMQPGESE
ncbi:single-stranded DNA-binding protein [Bordetella sp. FB-8]|uniref:single-stranded DNA-binding protein n=1 Tax=Bordetella sp. FB-8 TaxID=1159870 RepID=UPI000360AF32|nr:single-stranded DNA-binding protein [Bordetella sp. FB-8]